MATKCHNLDILTCYSIIINLPILASKQLTKSKLTMVYNRCAGKMSITCNTLCQFSSKGWQFTWSELMWSNNATISGAKLPKHWQDASNVIKLIISTTCENFLRFFMKIGDRNPGSQYCIVRMFCCHGSCSLSSQIVQLNSCHTRMQTIDDFQSYCSLSQEHKT